MRFARTPGGGSPPQEQGSRNPAFVLFCIFIVSYFLHFTARIQLLGRIHFDLILAVLTALAVAFGKRESSPGMSMGLDPVSKRLWILVGYVLVTIPFVEWPGSVLHNLENFGKSLSFFFFVLATVDTTRKLKVLLFVYVATQVLRVVEPLYMHVTSGYWGAVASLGNWEYMDRLSGSPYDIINPNGLAFVIIITLPLLHFLIKPDTTVRRLLWGGLACAMCYALVLSASRSGFVAFVFLCLLVIWRSKYRARLMAAAAVGGLVAFLLMTELQRERYVSIVSHDAPGAATAEGRITGVLEDIRVSFRRPLFGHGLGTSREANVHFRGVDQPSHNLYTETAEELGYIGLGLVLALIWSFVRACLKAENLLNLTPNIDARLTFLQRVANSLVVVVAVDLLFSLAAFGLSEPYWYLIGGLSVITMQLAIRLAPPAKAVASQAAAAPLQRPASRGARVMGLFPSRATRNSGYR
jgi:putative inorganic carbon (hco3(-)) transporter